MSHRQTESLNLSRRELFAGTGAAAALTMMPALASESGGQSELEIANETLVTNFCRDYSQRDVEVLAPYLADDVLYQIAESQPIINGIDEYRKFQANLGESFEVIKWKILRSHAIGPLVVNERVDYFVAQPDTRQPNMRFAVAGYFLVKDGKIQVWRDFGIPGSQQIISPKPEAREQLLEEISQSG